MTTFAIISLVCTLIPSLLYLRNRFLFRAPPAFVAGLKAPAVSILIPARNEEASILAALEHVIASRGVDWECIVLDDHSEDRTAEIVCYEKVADLVTLRAPRWYKPNHRWPSGWSALLNRQIDWEIALHTPVGSLEP